MSVRQFFCKGSYLYFNWTWTWTFTHVCPLATHFSTFSRESSQDPIIMKQSRMPSRARATRLLHFYVSFSHLRYAVFIYCDKKLLLDKKRCASIIKSIILFFMVLVYLFLLWPYRQLFVDLYLLSLISVFKMLCLSFAFWFPTVDAYTYSMHASACMLYVYVAFRLL